MSADEDKRRRYSAAFEFKNGSRDVLTVWESDADSAVGAARNWLEFSQDFPTDEAVNVVVEVIGDESDPGDIGIADMNDVVNHRRFSSEGEPVSTHFRSEPDEVRRLTAALRTSDEGNWPLIRTLLEERGVDVGDVAAVSTWEWRPERPQHAMIVTRGRHSYQFHDAHHQSTIPRSRPNGLRSCSRTQTGRTGRRRMSSASRCSRPGTFESRDACVNIWGWRKTASVSMTFGETSLHTFSVSKRVAVSS